MQAIETAEVRKSKAVGAAFRAVIVLGVVAGLAAIGLVLIRVYQCL